MKLNVAKSIADISGFEGDAGMFNIRQSSKAFKVLSSNIYSDKIRAVIREYSTNALDAHIMVNTPDKPFQVHLPNFYEPWFSVRDFGPGLTHQDVMTLYTTYFHSTKEDTNDQTGCLGLGSKSGFAYSDQFTVTSVFQGTKRAYTAYISEGGAPAINLISEETTTEPSGMEIYIPVKTADVGTFRERAQQVYQWFKVFPEITGQDLQLQPIDYDIQGSNWGVRQNASLVGVTCYAVQGPVAYPVQIKSFTEDMPPEVMDLLINGKLSIEFPMGSLNITASREDLEYDKNTQRNIINETTRVLKELEVHFTNLLSPCSTQWEAQHKAEEALEAIGGFRQTLRQWLLSKMEWNGEKLKLKGHFTIDTTRSLPVMDPLTNQVVNQSQVVVSVDFYTKNTLNAYNRKRSPERVGSKAGVEVAIDSRKGYESVIVYEDVKRKAPVRTILEAYANASHKVYVIKCAQQFLADVLADLGNPPVVNISSLPEPVTAPKVQKPAKPRVTQKIVDIYSYSVNTDRVENYDMPKGGHYLPAFDGKLVLPEKLEEKDWGPFSNSYAELRSAISQVIPGLTSLPPDLFLMSSSDRTWAKEPGWVNFYDVLKAKLIELLQDKQRLEALCYLNALYIKLNHNRDVTQGLSNLGTKKLTLTSKSSLMGKLLADIVTCSERAKLVNISPSWGHTPLERAAELLRGCISLGKFFKDLDVRKEVDKANKKVFNKVDKTMTPFQLRYPGVMNMFGRYLEFRDSFEAYINVCDKAKA